MSSIHTLILLALLLAVQSPWTAAPLDAQRIPVEEGFEQVAPLVLPRFHGGMQRDSSQGIAARARGAGGQEQESEAPRVSPGGAFLRGLLIPGWGHAATGAYTRGGFYFLAEAGTAWMLFKTGSLRNSARRIRDIRADAVEARLIAEGVHPDSATALVTSDPAVQDVQALVESREQQFEDWAALGIFFILIGAADAFVAGHLQDFPAPLSIRAVPAGSVSVAQAVTGAGGRDPLRSIAALELQLSFPWSGPGGGGSGR